MDGGSVAFEHTGEPVTAWRREKNLFRTESDSSEIPLADSGVQPVAFADRSGAGFVWQDNRGVRLLRGNGEARVLGAGGMYPAVAAGRDAKTAVVVWEAPAEGGRTLMADVLD
jgi:hypothetical protein